MRDYSTPVPTDQLIPGARPRGLRIAGRYVAWLEDATGDPFSASGIAVYDRLLGALAYRIPKASMPGEVHDLDLQDDGKVAFSFAGREGQVAWTSPADPSPHVLKLPLRAAYEVRIAGDRIGFEAGKAGGAGAVTLAEVGVTDLSGHRRRLGNLGEGSLFSDDFDFDGKQLTWWSYGCTRAFVHVVKADGPSAIRPSRSGCKLRLLRKPTVKGRRVRLAVDCFGFALGVCDTRRVTLVVRLKGRAVVVGRGHSARRVLLTAKGVALLRGHRRLKVRAAATLGDDAGRRERRTIQLTLRR